MVTTFNKGFFLGKDMPNTQNVQSFSVPTTTQTKEPVSSAITQSIATPPAPPPAPVRPAPVRPAPTPPITTPKTIELAAAEAASGITVPPPTPAADIGAVSTMADSRQAALQRQLDDIRTQSERDFQAAQQERSSLTRRLEQSLEQRQDPIQMFQEQRTLQGIPQKEEELSQLNRQIAERKADLDRALAGESTRLTSSGDIQLSQAQITRQAAVELGALTGLAAVMQGDIDRANQIVKQSVDTAYQAETNRINDLYNLLEINKESFSAAENKQAQAVKLQLDQQLRSIQDEKETIIDIQNLAVKAREKGLDMQSVISISQSKTVDQALARMASAGISTPEMQITDQKIANIVSGLKLSKFEQEDLRATLENYLANGDTESAVSIIKTKVFNSASASERDKLDGKKQSIQSLNRIEELLSEYRNFNGNLSDLSTIEFQKDKETGLWTGVKEKTLNKLGKTLDPQLARIANEIAFAIIEYRAAVSGAAFTREEARAYEAIFPSIGKSAVLNDVKINQIRDKMGDDIEAFYETRIGSSQYASLKNLLSEQVPNQDMDVPQVRASYSSVDSLIQAQHEFKSVVDSLRGSFSDSDILEFINQEYSFNTDLSTSQKGLSPLAQSIVAQESGGNYQAVGLVPAGMTEADRALGKYQIVPKYHFDKIGLPNTPEGRKRFLNSPDLQDKLFNMIIDELDTRYKGDPRKVAAAYYGGHGAAQIVGTPAADKPQSAGGKQFPSINQYVNSVLSRIS